MSDARKQAMQELGLYPKDSLTTGVSPREQAMEELGYIEPAGPKAVFPEEIDDKESGAINTLDRVLALNVGDPSGSYNTLKNKYGPKGYEFSQSTEGDIVFKTPTAPKWSRLDPGTRDPNPVTSLGGLAPNKMYDGSLKEFARDSADAAPDLIQGAATGAMGTIGALAAGRPGMTLGAGLAGAVGETARQAIGKVTGYREGPFSPAKIATQALVDAAIPNLIGSGASKKQIEDAVTKRGLASTAWDVLTGSKSEPIDRGVEILNKTGEGLTDPKLPPELIPDAVRQFKDDTVGLIPGLASAAWSGISRVSSDVKERAYRPIKDTALDLLEKSGVKFGVGVTPPKTLADAAPFVASQGRAGKMVEYISKTAKAAYDDNVEKAGKEINTALGKLKEPIDLSDERAIFDNAILDLESKKLRDPLQATQADKTIAALRANRERLFGAPEEGPSIKELKSKAIDNLSAKGVSSPRGVQGGPPPPPGSRKAAVDAVEKMTSKEAREAAGLPLNKDVLGPYSAPEALTKEEKARAVENTYKKMFGPKGSSESPKGLDAMGIRIWAVGQVKKMSPEEIRIAAGNLPGKSTKVDPDLAWNKFKTLKEMAGYFKRGDNPDLVNGEVQRIAAAAERSLDKKMYEKLNGVAGKDLSKQYKIYVNGEGDVPKLFANINAGLSTSGKAFTEKRGDILTAIKEYDDLYGTKIADQLEVLSVANDFGPKGEWFPKSGAGATSTGVIIQGGNAGKGIMGWLGNLVGMGQLENVGQVMGGMAGSSKFVRGATKAGNMADNIYGKMGGDWNPISTGQMAASPWMNLDNTDQNKKLLREREKG